MLHTFSRTLPWALWGEATVAWFSARMLNHFQASHKSCSVALWHDPNGMTPRDVVCDHVTGYWDLVRVLASSRPGNGRVYGEDGSGSCCRPTDGWRNWISSQRAREVREKSWQNTNDSAVVVQRTVRSSDAELLLFPPEIETCRPTDFFLWDQPENSLKPPQASEVPGFDLTTKKIPQSAYRPGSAARELVPL